MGMRLLLPSLHIYNLHLPLLLLTHDLCAGITFFLNTILSTVQVGYFRISTATLIFSVFPLFHICLYRPWLWSILFLVSTCIPIWSSALQSVFFLRSYLYIYPRSPFSSYVSKKPSCSAVAAVGKLSTTVTTACCCKAQHLQLSHSVVKLIRVSGP